MREAGIRVHRLGGRKPEFIQGGTKSPKVFGAYDVLKVKLQSGKQSRGGWAIEETPAHGTHTPPRKKWENRGFTLLSFTGLATARKVGALERISRERSTTGGGEEKIIAAEREKCEAQGHLPSKDFRSRGRFSAARKDIAPSKDKGGGG